MIDAQYQSTFNANPSRYSRLGTFAKRPAEGHREDMFQSTGSTTHKRQKSESHVDREGSTASTDNNLRASFLGFSLGNSAGNRASTTKTSYFRLKALGIKPKLSSGVARSNKRSRSQSVDQDAMSESYYGASPRLIEQSKAQDTSLMLPPPSKKKYVNDEDEALFARLQAARTSLRDGESLVKSGDFSKEDDLRKSTGSVSSTADSPSLVRARVEARLRASSAGSDLSANVSKRDAPAYRSRYSRFVPREEYPKAIDRANELRASRSRDVSRAMSPDQDPSQTPASHEAAPATEIDSYPSTKQPTFGFGQPSAPSSAFAPAVSNGDVSFGFGGFAPQSSTQDTPEYFHVDNEAAHDPSMQEPGDHTISPSYVGEALAQSFGSSTVPLDRAHAIQQSSHSFEIGEPEDLEVYEHSNPYAALAGDDEDDVGREGYDEGNGPITRRYLDDEEDEEEVSDEDGQGERYDDADAEDEELEDEEEEDDEEEGESEEYDEEDDEDGGYMRSRQERSVSKNPQLQDFGGTEGDAIELSD